MFCAALQKKLSIFPHKIGCDAFKIQLLNMVKKNEDISKFIFFCFQQTEQFSEIYKDTTY